MPFGKYKNRDLQEVPESYLRWYLRSSRALIDEIESELGEGPTDRDRGHGSSVPPGLLSITKELLEAGYRSLSRKTHPDLNNGVGHEKMCELNKAIEQLREVLR
jgi:Putative quorum-sensing-regulated virulence factor